MSVRRWSPGLVVMLVPLVVLLGGLIVGAWKWETRDRHITSCTITARTRSSVVLLMDDGHCKVMP